METKLDLKETTLDALQELVQINIDSSKGFREAAEAVENDSLRPMFNQLSVTRQQNATELQGYLRANDEKPEDSGSALGKMHRTWLEFRAALNGGDAKVILVEAERGEDVIKSTYEKLIKETTGSAMNDVLHRQYSQVKSQHDQIRNLRDIALEA